MTPDTRRAFNSAMAEYWAAPAYADATECETAFVAGMLEAARICNALADTSFGSGTLQHYAARHCAELIESSAKGQP